MDKDKYILIRNLNWLLNKSITDETTSYFDHTAGVASMMLSMLSNSDVLDDDTLKREYIHLMQEIYKQLNFSGHFGIEDNEGCCSICIPFFQRYNYEKLYLCYCDECVTV
tara:strand:- start:127 stop:456 length:330 start_codon:yes stop_codon:yes gene_type:complete